MLGGPGDEGDVGAGELSGRHGSGRFLSPDGSVVSAKKYKRMMPAPDATAVATSKESEEDTTARTGGIEGWEDGDAKQGR